jgi:hypothetical protein
MNAVAKRFIGSVRREALDLFLIINRNQLKAILCGHFCQRIIDINASRTPMAVLFRIIYIIFYIFYRIVDYEIGKTIFRIPGLS